MSRAKIATGHAPSPYLRRFRLPNLLSYRAQDDALSPEDEFGKMELIQAKMEELNRQALLSKKKDTNNDSESKQENEKKVQSASPTSNQPFYHPQRLFATVDGNK